MTRKPPAGLSERSLALWKSEVRHRTRSTGRLVILEQTCRVLDQADAFRQLRASQDVVTTSTRTATPHLNPLWRAEQEALTIFARLARLLDLQWDASKDGAPEAPIPYRSFLERTAKKYQENGR